MQTNNLVFGNCIYKKFSRIYFIIKAKPGSKRVGISSISEEQICVCLNAPAVEGKANLVLINYLSEIFDVSKSDVILEKGNTNKNKLISISDIFTEEEIIKILNKNLL
jgi:uncharacterized protein (TIGR00251 family)